MEKEINQEVKETNEILSENKPSQSRQRIISSLCQFAPFFIFPIMEHEDSIWKFLLMCVIVAAVGLSYLTIFQRCFMPKEACKDNISKGTKVFYYAMMLVCPVLTVVVWNWLPFGSIINPILAIVVNFGLTMFLCYKVASK